VQVGMLQALGEREVEPGLLAGFSAAILGWSAMLSVKTTIMPTTRSPIEEATS
jgi:hypothetical protein